MNKKATHQESIRIYGARQHNLKGLDLEIPLNRITVITGVSGSGKSSLAFDTLYAEGQRRYVETFSPYARLFMDRMDRPQVDRIEHIPPAIAIDRKDPVRTSRSTVGTMTELTDYVKLLYARKGQLHCRQCGMPVFPETPEHVWKAFQELPEDSDVVVTFPAGGNGTVSKHLMEELVRMGFDRILLAGEIRPIEGTSLEKGDLPLQVVADRFRWHGRDRKRIMDSIEQAFRFGRGRIEVWIRPDTRLSFSNGLECSRCGISYKAPLPNLFSFNSPIGACPRCRGFGRTIGMDLDLIIPDPSRSIDEGAIKPWGGKEKGRMEYRDLAAFCRQRKIPTHLPFRDLAEVQKKAIVEGDSGYYGIRGFFEWLETKTYKMHVRVYLSRYRATFVCPECKGSRFKEETLLYRVGGLNLGQVYAMSVDRAAEFFDTLGFPAHDKAGLMILGEIRGRLRYLREVGLGYLTLDRQSRTLSGGEVQRVALTSALGSSLVNTLYILDEPSIGLHPRDNHRLIRTMKGLRDMQNTVVVVEHDPEIIRESDYMLDLGPGAGEEGGRVMYFGPTSEVTGSLTGEYLRGEKSIPVPRRRLRPRNGKWLVVEGAAQHNLKEIDVSIPLGLFVCLTGVSGSGKSTFAEEVLYRGIRREKGNNEERPGRCRAIRGTEFIDHVVLLDQRPIGRTPRANPLTYVRAMEWVRRLFSDTADARARGLQGKHFSFNVAGGRCEACQGAGFEKVEMQFLSDVFITCPECNGMRFKDEVLEVRYRGKNITDVLSMTIQEALGFFHDQQKIQTALDPLSRVGLGYMRLGQPINTLSGGEAQRLKLSQYLNFGFSGTGLFIFDEPTTGLHFEDIRRLLTALRSLVDQGHTVLVIEHNMDVVKVADWVIDLGPEGGDEGGMVVVSGTPAKVASHRGSHTGRFLKDYLSARGRRVKAKAKARTTDPFPSYTKNAITVTGAREHNLRDLSLAIPKQQLVVVTGVSGSGKSSLVFDILFAEGQRRYLESLAPYVRQYMQIMERPDVDTVSGLSPTVAIEQRISHAGRRSTVATLTEIYHFLRLLYSKLGVQHCPECDRRLSSQDTEEILRQIRKRHGRREALVLAPKVAGRKGFHKETLDQAIRKGYGEARIDGTVTTLREGMSLSRYQEHRIEWVVGRLPAKGLERLVIRALEEGEGSFLVATPSGRDEVFSLHGTCPVCGIGIEPLDPRLFSFNSKQGACERCGGLGHVGDPEEENVQVCPKCGGSRLRPQAMAVKVNGHPLWDLIRLPASRSYEILKGFSFSREESPIAGPVMAEILMRLSLLNRLGLSYLPMGRSGDTLSGGEAQRIRLAAQLGSNLTGVSYILDEPTIGLHPRDNHTLLEALRELRDRGNSILVVEHDEETIKAADHIIDLGPGAGLHGGELVASGRLPDLKKVPASVTGASFDGHPRQVTSRLRPWQERPLLRLWGASEHNLKRIDVGLPLGTLICITGVSGSGKSTLLKETLFKGVRNLLLKQHMPAGACKGIEGWEALDRVLEVDHSPIGRTPRSVPASYVGFLSEIRRLLCGTPQARARGYGPARFSFNVAGGRCEACKGHGSVKVEMSLLPNVYVRCEVCEGRRFNQETLDITYKGKHIGDMLELTFQEATEFFRAVPGLRRAMELVCRIGLGYLRIGQPSPTLSGGEAQRIKLAEELVRPSRGRSLYILDEPTTGLHLADVKKLADTLQALVDQGNTVAVIEHNMEIIKEADYVIDLGPEGGDQGGSVVATGSPLDLLASPDGSHTARYLAKYVGND